LQLKIRWKLTIWITLGLTVVLACFAGLAYFMLHHALLEQTDRSLEGCLAQVRADPRIATAPEARLRYWIDEIKEHQNFLSVIYRSDGSILVRSPELPQASLLPLPGGAADLWRFSQRVPVLGRQRIMAERIQIGEQEFVAMLLAPLEPIDEELGEVRSVLLTAGPVTLILSAGLAYWLARTALAPMERLRRATDAITADHLEERLKVPNPNDELGLLTGTINAMIARLEGSFAETQRFTADASHELRTPLTALRTEVEVALSKQLNLPEALQVLENVLEDLVRMSRLTDQLLMLSRRDAGVEELTKAPVNLEALVAGVVEAMQPLAEAKGVLLSLDGEDGVVVAADEGRLRQVFINILDNALKYTPAGGQVRVRVVQRDRIANVVVEDTGVGIPPEHLGKVFDRFYRVDQARSRSEGGAGLGLSIARSIASAHGGTIDLASTPGKRTICTVTLPIS
jgi:heavy metal sensor kinase